VKFVPAHLVTEQGPTSAAVFPLPDNEMVGLGRNPSSSLVLLDRHVSRWHASISGRNGRFFLRDNSSVNGTRLDGRMVECETPLRDGQVIRAGAVVLRFRHVADEGGRNGPAPVRVDPAWLLANDRAAKHLTEAILAESNFALMPVLADALEDAGCRDADLLEHCRRGGPHRNGCWLLDLLLPPSQRPPAAGQPEGGNSTIPSTRASPRRYRRGRARC
jgi:hypothetical protein